MPVSSQETKVRYSPAHPDGIRRVQVGCGPRHMRPDWWNIDIRDFPDVDDVMDATRPWPWPNRLDYVYAEHFLEHLDIDEALMFFVEAGRSLRPGGRIRVSTPSLEWVLKTHFSFQPPESSDHLLEALATNRAFYGWGHRFLYTRGVLQALLREVGFEGIRFFRYGISDAPALSNMELHGGEPDMFGYPNQWIVEAERGATDFAVPARLLQMLNQELLEHVRPGH